MSEPVVHTSLAPLDPLPEPTRPGKYVVAAAATMALTLVGIAVGMVVLVKDEQPADLSAVRVFEDLRTDHTRGTVDYDMTPPAGGPHADRWLACGVYDEQVPDENAVHALEHGTVWITYRPGLDQDDVDRLAALLPEEGILSPYDGVPGPVVVSVWGRQLVLSGADDDRLELFIEEYGDGHTSPEPFASCVGGVDGSGEPTTAV